MNKKTIKIKASFLANLPILGNSKDAILDELDMAIFQHRELRDSPRHDELLRWGESVLDDIGIV